MPSNSPVVLLREREGGRYLPIWVGAAEATAIKSALDGTTPHRPMTHDLFVSTLLALGASVDQVVVTDVLGQHVGEQLQRPVADLVAVGQRPHGHEVSG